MSVKPAKPALCIKKKEAPLSVQNIVAGTFLLPLTDELFATSTQLEDRATCETDESLLQILPYVLITDERGYVFRYFRGKGGTEGRLHGKISIGVGGHVERTPTEAGMNLFELCKDDAQREILEEIGMWVDADKINFQKLVYNPEGVNAVHLGLLAVAVIDSVRFNSLQFECDVIEHGEFVDPRDLVQLDVYGRLEPWSQAAVWHLLNVSDFDEEARKTILRHHEIEISVDYHQV